MIPETRILSSANPPSPEPGTTLFETNRLIFRRYSPSDAEALSACANFPQIWRCLSDRFPSPYTVEAAAAFLARNNIVLDPHYPTKGAIMLKPNTVDNPSPEPVMIGGFGLHPEDDILYRTWTIGYFFTPSAWGKGLGTEAIGALVRWAFATWPGLQRIDGTVYASNPASVRVLEKSGFVREGVKRQAAEKDGKLVDLVVLGVLRSDVGMGEVLM